jgi:hypothetical protein
MNTLTLISSDFDSDGTYIGKTNLSNFDGNLIIEVSYAYFPKLVIVTGSIQADGSIKAGDSIKAGGYFQAGDSIKADGYFEAGDSIKADGYIEAGGSIKAGGYIQAGGSIEAGDSIQAGLYITCKELSAKLRIFAGLCLWKIPDESETVITCEKLISGTVSYGRINIVEAKKETPSCAGKVVEIDGKKYKLVEA